MVMIEARVKECGQKILQYLLSSRDKVGGKHNLSLFDFSSPNFDRL